MNTSGLPRSPQDGDDVLISFQQVVNWVVNGAIIAGSVSFVLVSAFLWGYFTS